MKIAIATTGRFHVLDLARELDRCGEHVRFFSHVPRHRAEKFGLPHGTHKAFLPLVAPLVAWQRGLPRLWPDMQLRALTLAMDAAVTARLEPCDVFIGMSGLFTSAARHARDRFGARIYIERGSQHIVAQRRILEQAGARRLPGDFIIAREHASYELADRIVVPSTPVVESFRAEAPHLSEKLFLNPYGVDLSLFPQRAMPARRSGLRLLFVGGWSMRKGCDVLTEAVRLVPEVSVKHVGQKGDCSFPENDSQFEHVGPVPQWALNAHYAEADALVLVSREEGLALVQPQALASGLPIICTPSTGGADLRMSEALSQRITVVPQDDAEALAKILRQRAGANPPPMLNEQDRALLSWAAYGTRYHTELTGVDRA